MPNNAIFSIPFPRHPSWVVSHETPRTIEQRVIELGIIKTYIEIQ